MALSPIDLGKLNTQWNAMTCENMHIGISTDTINLWMVAIVNAADKFPVANAKTNLEMYHRFLDGLPSIFLSISIQYKSFIVPPANITFPALYAAPHPLAPAVHPQAGEYDLSLVEEVFQNMWDNMIENNQVVVKNPGKRLENVMQVDLEEYTEDEWQQYEDEEAHWAKSPGVGGGRPNAFPPRNGMRRFFGRPSGKGDNGKAKEANNRKNGQRPFRPVDKSTVCFACGGVGHFAHKMVNGERTPWCRTDSSGPNAIDVDILKGFKYPHIQNPRNKEAKANAADLEDEPEPEFTNGEEDNTEEAGNALDIEETKETEQKTKDAPTSDETFWNRF